MEEVVLSSEVLKESDGDGGGGPELRGLEGV